MERQLNGSFGFVSFISFLSFLFHCLAGFGVLVFP
jgi:hypothetical protein